MPALVGIVADRWIQAQKMLSLCHVLAGAFMLAAGIYGLHAGDNVSFAPLFALYTMSVAFFYAYHRPVELRSLHSLKQAGLIRLSTFHRYACSAP